MSPTPRRWCDPPVLACLVAIAFGVGWAVHLAQPDRPSESSAEAGFARDMAVHHAQAVDLAQTEQTRTADDDLRVLARDLALTQQAQLGQLRGWLDQWGLPPTTTAAPMGWMGHDAAPAGDAAMSGMAGMDRASVPMPGMATAAELEAMRTAPVEEADVAFLRLMVRHHQGGVLMAQAVLDRTDRPEVRRFAEATVAAQRSEIRTLTTLLAERGGTPFPAVTMADEGPGDDGATWSGAIRLALRSLPLAIAAAAALWLVITERRLRGGDRRRSSLVDDGAVAGP